MTHAPTPATREQQYEAGARFLCATALAYRVHGLSVDVLYVDEEGFGEASGGVRVIDASDAGRIGLVGYAVQLERRAGIVGQDAAIQHTLDVWQDTVVSAVTDDDADGDDGLLKVRRILESAPWAIAFVAANRDLITELAALLLASGGHLEPAAFLPIVDGRITQVSPEANRAALAMLEPYEAQLKEIQESLSEWQRRENR